MTLLVRPRPFWAARVPRARRRRFYDELNIRLETAADVVGRACGGVRALGHERIRVDIRDMPCFGGPVRLISLKRRGQRADPNCVAETSTETSTYMSPGGRSPINRAPEWHHIGRPIRPGLVVEIDHRSTRGPSVPGVRLRTPPLFRRRRPAGRRCHRVELARPGEAIREGSAQELFDCREPALGRT